MTVDRTRIRDERGVVTGIEELGGGMVELSVRLPHIAAHAQPGQFAQLRVADATAPLLRRPFSVAWVDADVCAFVFGRVGEGTRALGALTPGAEIDALGPLGTGFTITGITDAVCVSGGLGCAPFPLLAHALRDAGANVTIVSGAATAERLYPAERFQRGDNSIRVVETTDDGTKGATGRVTDLVAPLISATTSVFACGPNPMLASLAKVLGAAVPASAEASLEAPMGCGYGTCLGCALPAIRDGERVWALCCSDGPVMQVGEVDWVQLLALPGASVA